MADIKIQVNDTRTFGEKVHDKIEEVRYKAKVTGENVVTWARENPESAVTVLAIAGGAIGLATKIVKFIRPSAAEMHERRMDKTYYDPSTGMHWDLKRNLTNKDRIEIMDRKRGGEFTEDILRDMRVLKK